jgi:aspartate oxidase
LGLRNGVQTALLITQGALRNRYSIGCHYRLN